MTPPKDMSEKEKFEKFLRKKYDFFDNEGPYYEAALLGLSYGLKLAAERASEMKCIEPENQGLICQTSWSTASLIAKDIMELEGEFKK